jgi:hypothetical protein
MLNYFSNTPLEHLSDEEASQKIAEIKALNVHTWWGLCVSDRIADLIWGRDRPVLTPEQHENDEEVYMAIFPKDKPVNNGFTNITTRLHITTRLRLLLRDFKV